MIPGNAGANVAIRTQLTVGADFSFLNLLGEGSNATTGTSAKMLGLRLQYAL